MPRTTRIRSSSGIYHIVLRGINKQRIFEEDEDYQMFFYFLKKYKDLYSFSLYAWCLMPNHIHLLIKEGCKSISQTVRIIGTCFVHWYNKKYQRVGHLFQDRFRSEIVEDDFYFLTVIRYIHLNPVKAGLCPSPDIWPYSSYSRIFNDVENTGNVLLFQIIKKKDFIQFHQEKNNDICLDFDHAPVRKISDDQAEKIVNRETGCERISLLQSLPKEEQDRSIQILLRAGASVNQISRLTGISVPIIQKIKESK